MTALWDWSPVASWDSGKHWPSWQTKDDGSGMNYFGEGGGCFGVGESKYVLCMHHHNVAFSSRCGKNMSRLVVPNGASVTPPEFTRKAGSRSVPSGEVYAMMTMGKPPWTAMPDKSLTCTGNESRGDLGVHNHSYECQSHLDFGSVYNWYSGANVAVWRGNTDKHCVLCKLSGDPSTWGIQDAPGSVVFAPDKRGESGGVQRLPDLLKTDRPKEDGDGVYAQAGGQAAERRARHKFEKHVRKAARLELGDGEPPIPTAGFDLARQGAEGGNPQWLLKSFNYGGNWTWLPVPEFLQGFGGVFIDPTNASTLYAIKGSCISRSYDGAETWSECWKATGLEGSFKSLHIRDSQTMLLLRNGAVPLRTKDGGTSWHELPSVPPAFAGAAYSWSGQTLAISHAGPVTVWVSTDDGDTWIDESADYSALTGGIAQWYDNTLYVCSLGQGIVAKVFNESAH
eukprot:COSAG01_NODE_503_length_16167_cov_10.407230_26_plen_454_part_00